MLFRSDDFGTGYSSLTYLNQFPLDTLKVDQTFVRAIHDGAGAAAIVRAILALAASLGLRCVAEGVETRAQYDFLAAHGCGYAQGLLVGAPGPAGDIPALAGVR